ncbi:MAG: sugar phosphate nucleotidyltransferase [Synechococcales bacterium]|nr:sugar phosphate nucleotidyltransferase [Synechococcales bacterium]
MKVVLFCGGLGTRMRDYSESIPKPMVPIGYRPILWHVMRYYAHFGHKEFILCLGYKADVIKNYFLNYNEWLSNDFTYNGGDVVLKNSDIHDWKIHFVDTGLSANVGMRLKAVERYLDGEETFLANYSDGLTDLDLNTYIDNFHKQDKVASCLCVRPSQTFHLIDADETGLVNDIKDVTKRNIWINGGYLMFKREIFDYINYGEDMVNEPFQRLIQAQQFHAYKYQGFFGVMDTFREKQQMDEMYARRETPWEVWRDRSLQKVSK